jgi:hypothetical protein
MGDILHKDLSTYVYMMYAYVTMLYKNTMKVYGNSTAAEILSKTNTQTAGSREELYRATTDCV